VDLGKQENLGRPYLYGVGSPTVIVLDCSTIEIKSFAIEARSVMLSPWKRHRRDPFAEDLREVGSL
jgi:hypothetical protein